MKKFLLFKITLVFILTLVFISCEKESQINVELPYSEKVVIRGYIKPSSDYLIVNFSKTLPVSEEYNIKKAELKDVVAYVKDSIRIYPLYYKSNGDYTSLSKIMFSPNNTYELFAIYQNKKFYAKTIVPELPEVRSLTLTTEGNSGYLKTNIELNPKFVYGANWVIYSGNEIIDEGEDLYSLTEPRETPFLNYPLRTGLIPEKYMSSQYQNRLGMHIYVFDKQFYNYYKTKNFNQPIKDIFTQNGGPVNWNIAGDAIGLFIGMADFLVNRK